MAFASYVASYVFVATGVSSVGTVSFQPVNSCFVSVGTATIAAIFAFSSSSLYFVPSSTSIATFALSLIVPAFASNVSLAYPVGT